MAKTKTKPVDGDRHAMLRIDLIRTDGDTQPRAGVSDELAAEYAASYEAGIELPPVDVVFDGKDYWLWDGFHRMEAHRQSGAGLVLARVREGTLADAQWLCLSANRGHGLRRTNADKRRAVELALARKPDLSNRTIADHCGVSEGLVRDARDSLRKLRSDSTESAARTGKDGRTINTANIGKKPVAEAKTEQPGKPEMTPDETQANAQAALDQWKDQPVGTTATVEIQPTERLTDEGKREVPTVAQEAFVQVTELRKVGRVIGEVIDEIERLGRSPAGRCMHTQSIVSHLKSAKDGVWQSRPAHVCPYCRGENPKLVSCRACAGSAWVTTSTFKAAPEELRGGAEG